MVDPTLAEHICTVNGGT